jgi:hypothetical protein
MRFKATRDFNIEQTPYRAGDEIEGDDIPAGTLASLTSVCWLVPVGARVPTEVIGFVSPSQQHGGRTVA